MAEYRAEQVKKKRRVEEHEGLIVVLEGCPLETAKIGKEYELLNSDDHFGFLSKHKKDPAIYRPDIAHQCLLMLMDSPLNKAGKLRVFVHTHKNVLIEINPQCRIPRTYKRFAGLMVQLLHKLKIRSTSSSEPLMKVVRNPVTSHFPANTHIVAASYSADRCVDLQDFLPTFPAGCTPVWVVGGIAHGQIEAEYAHDWVGFSKFPLSGAGACARLCTTYEQMWNIL